MKLSQVLGANGQAVCDCGTLKFFVLIRTMPNGNNHIVVLECVNCGHELVTPYSHGGPILTPQTPPTHDTMD